MASPVVRGGCAAVLNVSQRHGADSAPVRSAIWSADQSPTPPSRLRAEGVDLPRRGDTVPRVVRVSQIRWKFSRDSRNAVGVRLDQRHITVL